MAVIPPDFHGDARKWDSAYLPISKTSAVDAFSQEYTLSSPDTVQVTTHTGPRLDTHPLAISKRLSPFDMRFDDTKDAMREMQRSMMATLAHKVKNDLPFCLDCPNGEHRTETERDHVRGENIVHMRLLCKAPGGHCDRSRSVTVDSASLTPPPWLDDTTGPAWHRRSEPFKAHVPTFADDFVPAPKPRPKDEPETMADAW